MSGLNPQTIGTSMPNGFAGSFARQPDMIVNTRRAGALIPFGVALKYEDGAVVPMGAGSTAAQFVGIAGKEIKTSLTYLDQSVGQYAPDEPVSVFQRGSINVICQLGAPVLSGAVHLRVTANPAYPIAVVGGLETAADGANTIELTNCQWAGKADPNGVAELRILTMNNA